MSLFIILVNFFVRVLFFLFFFFLFFLFLRCLGCRLEVLGCRLEVLVSGVRWRIDEVVSAVL